MAQSANRNPALLNSSRQEIGPLGQSAQTWLIIAMLGIVARLAVSGMSKGTNDAATFLRFAHEIKTLGLMETYRTDIDFNHPPIPGYWSVAARAMAGWSDHAFTFIFKLPVIAADVVSIWLLWKIQKRRTTPARAAAIAAGFAWSLDSILVSGYHCNTDCIYAMFCLMAVYLIEDRNRYFWGGLALAAAVNVKIIPVLLIPPLLLACANWRSAVRFLAGLAVGVIPFSPMILAAPVTFFRNVLAYNSLLDHWGLNYFLLWSHENFDPHASNVPVIMFYYSHARYLIFGLIGLWAVCGYLFKRWNRCELAAVTFAIFLILTPGFGVQYTVMVGALMFAIRPGLALVYAGLAGAFVGGAYFVNWTGDFPAYSQFRSMLSAPVAAIGLTAWITLLAFVAVVLIRPKGHELALQK